jgi:DNA invertase Pin-like site-specific DNA recombinase
MRAAIYSRFSTDKQTESSIADQVRVCTERAAKDGHKRKLVPGCTSVIPARCTA